MFERVGAMVKRQLFISFAEEDFLTSGKLSQKGDFYHQAIPLQKRWRNIVWSKKVGFNHV